MSQRSFICFMLLAHALDASASSVSSKSTEFCSTRFEFDCLGDKEQMRLMAQPIFNNRNAGCHLLKTEEECIGSKDGRPEFSDSPCHWCCGTNCTTDDTTSLCEPWEKVRNHPHYIGKGRNAIGEKSCPKAPFYMMYDSYCPSSDDVLSEGQCRQAVEGLVDGGEVTFDPGLGFSVTRHSMALGVATPVWNMAWWDCSYNKLCFWAADGRNEVFFNKCPVNLAPKTPPHFALKSICQPPDVPDPDVKVRNTSKPAWADLDKDGDLDLIVGNQYGELHYYERMNDGSLLLREGDHDPFQGIDFGIGAAPAFVDWDEDGDPDLVIGNDDGKLRYYENTGDNTFVSRAGDANPFHGIDVGSHAAPTFADWNRNGYMDLVIGNQEGKLYWYERNHSLSLKAEDENPFKDIDVGLDAAPTFVDWDKDSDLDLIIGNSQGNLLYYEWLLGIFLMRTGEQNPFNGIDVGSKAAPSVLHLDQALFVAIGNEFGGLPHYRRTKVNSLNDRLGISNPFLGVPVGSDAAPAPVDWDSDGDQDLIVGKEDGQLLYFERIDENQLLLRVGNESPFRDIDVGDNSRPAVVDWNADAYMDLVVGNETGELTYFERVANNRLLMRRGIENPFGGVKVDGKAAPAFVDWNNDGIQHLVVGSASGDIKFYKREDNTLSLLVNDTNPFKDITLKSQSTPAFADWDNDFDMDLVVGNSDGTILEYNREGDVLYPITIDVSPFRFVTLKAASKPAFADWDDDGDMDLIIGGVKSGEGRDGIAYQMNGCPQVNDCNRRGNCQHSGVCRCLDGYRARGDCGVCDAGFFAAAAPPATLNCERCPSGKHSEEAGGDCNLCAAGRYSPGGRPQCDECQVGRFSEVGQSECTFCESGRALHQGTSFSGTYTSKHCFCEKGSYASASGQCISCPHKQYCPFDDSDDPKLCPKGSETLDLRTKLEDCRCSKGYGITDNHTCQLCQSGRFKDLVDNLECKACAQAVMQSPSGSTDSQNCSCNRNFYYARSGQDGRCMRCGLEGIVCDGGYGIGTQSHVLPYADVDYYLTGEMRVVKCAMQDDGTSYCLGGREKARPCVEGCHCREGHDGFLCQNCKVGFTRDRYDESCRPCSELGPSWLMIIILNLGPIGSSIVFIVFASMAATAGLSTQRVHTALLRLWQSWVLSMVCLQNFDFSQISLFAWSIESAKADYLAENPEADEGALDGFLGAFGFNIPPWFQEMVDTVYGASVFLVQLGSPTEIMNCLAERFTSEQDALDYRHYWHAMWWATYTILVFFWLVVLGLVIVYILFPPLDRRGWFPPSNPMEFRDWAFKLLKPKLLRAIRTLGCDEQDEDEILAEMRVLFGHMDFGFKTLEAVAGNPVGGLGPMTGRLEDEQKERAKRVVFLIFKPKLKRAMESVAKTFCPKSKGGDAEKQTQASAFQYPWGDKILLCFWPMMAGLGFDVLVEGCTDPVAFVKGFADNDDGKLFVIQLLMPAFRMSGIKSGCDVQTLDEVWINIEDGLSGIECTDLMSVFVSGGSLDSLSEMLMGPGGSFLYTIHKRPQIVEFLASEQGGSLEGDELHRTWKKIIFYSGSVELALLMAWSPAQIAANAMSYTVAGEGLSDAYKTHLEEMREEALKIQSEAVLYLADGPSGNIADYAVFGIWHAKPSLWQFLLDLRPVILIALYTMWYETTTQLLLLIHCDPFAVEDDQGLVSMDQRWMKNANWKCLDWGSKHVPVALISAVGLLVWSLGTLFVLAFLVFRNRHHMAEPAVSRLYAYFVQGYEIEYCWWDVLVKRLDLLCTVVITYTNLASDRKAKLLCYTALSAIVLMLHAGSQPFDDRKNRLLDRYEYIGLLVRFTTFSIMEFLLIFNPGSTVSIICCVVVGIAGSLFFLAIWFTIIIEFVSDTVNRGHEATLDDLEELMDAGMGQEDSSSRMGGVMGAVTSPAKVIGKFCGKYVCKAALQGLLIIATRIGLTYSKMEYGALALKFGDGRLDIWTRKEQEYEQLRTDRKSGNESKSKKELLKLKGEHTLEAFFHLNDDSQRQYLATTIGAFYVHLLSTMGSESIPSRSLECFIVLCASMKAAKLDGLKQTHGRWSECGIEEKYNLMIEGIPAAVQQVKGKSQDAEPVRKRSKYESWIGAGDENMPESTQKEISASPSARAGIQATAVTVDEDLQAEEEEEESNKMRLHAEELNESLMILFRIERTKFFDAVETAAEALDKWVDPEPKPENDQGTVEGNDALSDALKVIEDSIGKWVNRELEPEDALKLVKKSLPSGESTWSLCLGKTGQQRELGIVFPGNQSKGQTSV